MEGGLCNVGAGGTLFKRFVAQFSVDIYTAIDSAISKLERMPNRDASVAKLERVREYCAEHSILPERSKSRAGMRRADGPTSARDTHGHSLGSGDSARQATVPEATRDGRDER